MENAVVDAMASMINLHTIDNDLVIAVKRSADPLTEWNQNGDITAGAFPCLFMTGGDMLPKGSWPAVLIRHLMCYYDGCFEQNTKIVSTILTSCNDILLLREPQKLVRHRQRC